MPRCEGCPNAVEKIAGDGPVVLPPGRAFVGLKPEGGIVYGYAAPDGQSACLDDMSAETVREQYPYLAARIENCRQPLQRTFTQKKIFGLLVHQVIQRRCGALNFKTTDAESVQSYFQPAEE